MRGDDAVRADFLRVRRYGFHGSDAILARVINILIVLAGHGARDMALFVGIVDDVRCLVVLRAACDEGVAGPLIATGRIE